MRTTQLAVLTFATLAFGTGCVHTPRGTSVQIALARKAELVRLPTPPASPILRTAAAPAPAVEILRPEKTERVADAFARGQFCMSVGNDPEAITAFEEAVKMDPSFADAWQRLAVLYEKGGDEKKAMEAFRKSKMVADMRPVRAS